MIGNCVEVLKIVFGIVVGFGFQLGNLVFGLGVSWTQVGWFIEGLSWGVIGFVLSKEGVKIKPLPHLIYLFNNYLIYWKVTAQLFWSWVF